MSEQDRYIAGVPCWVDTAQPDPKAAAEFYGGLFGWEFEDVMPAGSPVPYLMARLPGGDVGAITGQPADGPAAWNTYVWVQDADATAAKVRAAGGSVQMEPNAARAGRTTATGSGPESAAVSGSSTFLSSSRATAPFP